MRHAAFSKVFIPSVDGEFNFELLPYEQQGLVRSMNRGAKLAVACALKLDAAQRDFLTRHPAETAVYCAAEPVTAAQPEVLAMLKSPGDSLSKRYSQFISPKWGLQCGASMVAPCLSIFLGAEGGVHTFSSSRHAGLQAWRQAQLDLRLGNIRVAVICAVNSGEDPFVVKRNQSQFPKRIFTEGAVLAVLTENELNLEMPGERTSGELHFGAADSLMQAFWTSAKRSPE